LQNFFRYNVKALFRQLASALPGQDGGAETVGASAAENIVITPTPSQPAKKKDANCAC